MNDDTYNGWTNRETWAAALHLNNDEGMQRDAMGIAQHEPSVMATGEALIEYLRDAIWEWITSGDQHQIHHAYMVLGDIGSFWRIDALELGNSFRVDALEVE